MEVKTTNRKSEDEFLPTLPTLQALLEVSSKFFIAAAAVLYAIGILVVSAHLSRYGSLSVSLFRVTYVLAGVWATIPLILCAVAFSFGRVLGDQFADHQLQSNSLLHRLFGKNVASMVLPGVRNVAILWNSAVLLIALAGLVFLVGAFISFSPSKVWLWVLVGAGYIVHQSRQQLGNSLRNSAFSLSLILAIGVLYMLGFGRFAYREIPAVLGGGAAQRVRVVLQPEAAKTLEPLAAGTDSKPEWTEVELVAETEREFLFAMGPNTIRLSRDMVKIMVLKSEAAQGEKRDGK
jgi:hypothetical protein